MVYYKSFPLLSNLQEENRSSKILGHKANEICFVYVDKMGMVIGGGRGVVSLPRKIDANIELCSPNVLPFVDGIFPFSIKYAIILSTFSYDSRN